jgi:hypothetical protein
MPSGIRETTKPQLEIYLEKPWGGVASNADAVDILDNQFVTCQGLVDINGVLCFNTVLAPATQFKFNPHVTNAVPYLFWNMGVQLFCLDQFGNIYACPFIAGVSAFNYRCSASDGPWANTPFLGAVIVINGLTYISNYNTNSIYTFNGVTTFAVASAYVGGIILGVLDDYLLQMNVNQTVDGEQSTRVNWSGPGEFSTWDPSIDRTAGFNTLPNIQEMITGFISLASVGIIIGTNELVEMSPTGIGIEPFSFTTLWESEVGQGILYGKSIVQYGQNTYGGTDTGIFKISTAGFQEVSGVARTAILGPVQIAGEDFPASGTFSPQFAGSIMLYSYNSSYPTPHYVFVESLPAPVGTFTSSQLILWFLNLETGAWYNVIVPVDSLVNQQNGTSHANGQVTSLTVISLNTQGLSGNLNNLPNILISGVVLYSGTIQTTFIATNYVFNKNNFASALLVPGVVNLVSKAWEMKLGRQPTIRRIIIRAYGSGILSFSINGVNFGGIQLDGTNVAKTYKTQQGIFTGEEPQLTVTSSNFAGAIVKIMLAGTYADGDID